ncbi:MAG: hypothetical protein J1F29_00590 [Lentimicrobiaceae bacterium]|nr:hypothetical protein [Lentimicrobiaceae bacterium]
MQNEEEIKADFWTQKVALLKNILRYGAPAFTIDLLYDTLLQSGLDSNQVEKTSTRSFFGSQCPTLRLSLCRNGDIVIVQNNGIQSMEMSIQQAREPVLLTGAEPASVVDLLKAYRQHYPRYKEALDKLLHVFQDTAKEEAKRQKIKKIALANLHLVLPQIFKDSSYHTYLRTQQTEAILCVRLNAGKTLEIPIPYERFQEIPDKIIKTVAHFENALAQSPLQANVSDTDFWNDTAFVANTSPNK